MSVDSKIKFTPADPSKAVYFASGIGPSFGYNSLNAWSEDLMNAPNNCLCLTKGYLEYFNVKEDAEGNSILTGDGKGTQNKYFTLIGLETWKVLY